MPQATILTLVLTAVMAGFAPGLLAEDNAQTVESARPGEVDATSGQRAYIDPESGELRRGPPPDEIRSPLPLSREMQRSISRSYRALPTMLLPGGGMGVDLDGRFRNLSVAVTGDDGAVKRRCIPSDAIGHTIDEEASP